MAQSFEIGGLPLAPPTRGKELVISQGRAEHASTPEQARRTSMHYRAALRTQQLSTEGVFNAAEINDKPYTAARAVQIGWNKERQLVAQGSFEAAKQDWAEGVSEVVEEQRENDVFMLAMAELGLQLEPGASSDAITEYFATDFYANFCDPNDVEKNVLALSQRLSAEQVVVLEPLLKPLFSEDEAKQEKLFGYLQDLVDAKEVSLEEANAATLAPGEAEKLAGLREYLPLRSASSEEPVTEESITGEESVPELLVPGKAYATEEIFTQIAGKLTTRAFEVQNPQVIAENELARDQELLTKMKEEGLHSTWTKDVDQEEPVYAAGIATNDSRYNNVLYATGSPAIALAAVSAENPAEQALVFQTIVNALLAAHASDTDQAHVREFLEMQQNAEVDNPEFSPWVAMSKIEFNKIGMRLQKTRLDIYDVSKSANENLIVVSQSHPEIIEELSDITKPENADMLYSMTFGKDPENLALDIDKTLAGIKMRAEQLALASEKGQYTLEELRWIGQLSEMYAVLPVVEKLRGEKVDLSALPEETDESDPQQLIPMTRPQPVDVVEGSGAPIQEVVRMHVGEGTVHVMHGDITALPADAVICIADEKFSPYSYTEKEAQYIRTPTLLENNKIVSAMDKSHDAEVESFVQKNGTNSIQGKRVPFGSAIIIPQGKNSGLAEGNVLLLNLRGTGTHEIWQRAGFADAADFHRRELAKRLTEDEITQIIDSLVAPAIENAFKVADGEGISSIALHTLGRSFSGIRQMDYAQGVEAVLLGYQSYLQAKKSEGKEPTVTKVYLTVDEPVDKEHIEGSLGVMEDVFENLQTV